MHTWSNDRGESGWWFPRWVDVHIVGRGPDNRAKVVYPGYEEKPLDARLFRCKCGTEYATWGTHKAAHSDLCRECDRAMLTQKQRYRRAEKRRWKLNRLCAHCKSPMKLGRVSKRFCSTICRVAAFRTRRESV
jgi:hypothetical protein